MPKTCCPGRAIDRPAWGHLQRGSSDATCLMSLLDQRSQNGTGLAIIDTGASRSVIGSDNVPAVLQKLPSNTHLFSFWEQSLCLQFQTVAKPSHVWKAPYMASYRDCFKGHSIPDLNQDDEKFGSNTGVVKQHMFSEYPQQVTVTAGFC